MKEQKMAKAKSADNKGDKQYAEGPDTATLERPDSTRSQRALIQSAPADRALHEVQTPSATSFLDADGNRVEAYPVTKELANGTTVVEVEGGGHVAAGTLGKTATDAEGTLLRAKEYVEARFGGKVTVDKKGIATVAAPKFAGKASDDRGASAQNRYEVAEGEKAAARKGFSARKASPKKAKGGTAKTGAGV